MKHILILLAALGLAACSSNDELPDIGADAGEQQIYEEAQRYLRNDNYDLAVRSLQQLEARYPFGKYAEQRRLAWYIPVILIFPCRHQRQNLPNVPAWREISAEV